MFTMPFNASKGTNILIPVFNFLQIFQLVNFLKRFIDDNPLCVCSEEINLIKKNILKDTDEIKLKQKNSQIVLKLKEKNYYLNAKILVPEMYPDQQIRWDKIVNI